MEAKFDVSLTKETIVSSSSSRIRNRENPGIPSRVRSFASICNSYLTPTLRCRLCRRWIEVFSDKIIAIEVLSVAKLNVSRRDIIRQERMRSITLDDFFTNQIHSQLYLIQEPDRCERLIAARQYCSDLRLVDQEVKSMPLLVRI